jgi:hypothetical protein
MKNKTPRSEKRGVGQQPAGFFREAPFFFNYPAGLTQSSAEQLEDQAAIFAVRGAC